MGQGHVALGIRPLAWANKHANGLMDLIMLNGSMGFAQSLLAHHGQWKSHLLVGGGNPATSRGPASKIVV